MADLRALTVRQPFADLIMAGVKDVENRTWAVPSTLPQWQRCRICGGRHSPDGSTVWPTPGGITCHDVHEVGCHLLVADGPFPFRLGIHAAARFADGWGRTRNTLTGELFLWHRTHGRCEWVGQDHLGALLGTVEVTGCHHADECRTPIPTMTGVPTFDYCSRWAEPDAWHWTLADPQPLDVPIPMRGRQGLWRLPAEVTADA